MTQRDILLNALITIRGPRLLSRTSSSPTSTSPRWNLITSQDSSVIKGKRASPSLSSDTKNVRPRAKQQARVMACHLCTIVKFLGSGKSLSVVCVDKVDFRG
ncbi:hypothetical protein F511_15616 [Dorcoceras hygrometricum]|uniref:Uncharacterized protein n=1 Tax=Dorcoceras hygrometricum TaxID=472368 RepID=A0A2Z7AI27_9LAMI|nr:hypothetical protein F511_15616 [Dorcoceras hygrometricum]